MFNKSSCPRFKLRARGVLDTFAGVHRNFWLHTHGLHFAPHALRAYPFLLSAMLAISGQLGSISCNVESLRFLGSFDFAQAVPCSKMAEL